MSRADPRLGRWSESLADDWGLFLLCFKEFRDSASHQAANSGTPDSCKNSTSVCCFNVQTGDVCVLMVRLTRCSVDWRGLHWRYWRCWASTVWSRLATSHSGHLRRWTMTWWSCHVAVLPHYIWARRRAGERCRWSDDHDTPRPSVVRWRSAVVSSRPPGRGYRPVWKQWDTADDLRAPGHRLCFSLCCRLTAVSYE